MTVETLIAIVSLAVALIGTPSAVVVSLLVFRGITDWRLVALEKRTNSLEEFKEQWRALLQEVRDEINGLRVDIAKRLPKETIL